MQKEKEAERERERAMADVWAARQEEMQEVERKRKRQMAEDEAHREKRRQIALQKKLAEVAKQVERNRETWELCAMRKEDSSEVEPTLVDSASEQEDVEQNGYWVGWEWHPCFFDFPPGTPSSVQGV